MLVAGRSAPAAVVRACLGLLVIGALAAVLLAGPSGASAAGRTTCTGTVSDPGVLAGDYRGEVIVRGACAVNSGRATVHGTLLLTPGSVVVAAFGLNHRTGSGGSSLTVDGSVRVMTGATLFLGCLPSSFPCLDDPNPSEPTLSSAGRVTGNLIGSDALGIIVHDSTIAGNVSQRGGGGGVSCAPRGVFERFGSPVYSDYEDSTVGGSLAIRSLNSCWLGVARVHIGGGASFLHVQLADPDGIEIIANEVRGNLVCRDNSMVWDSAELSNTGALFPRAPEPNTVHGQREGQCVLSSPMSENGPTGPGPF